MKDLNQNKTLSHEWLNSRLIRLRYKELEKYYRGETCLELWSADWEWTKMLVPHFKHIVAVDWSTEAIEWAKKFVGPADNVEYICSYFEQLELNEKFDILEHVDNSVEIIRIAKKFLKDNWVLIADVPNAKSIHREIWVRSGFIPTIYSLNSADISIWHQRVYDLDTFSADLESAGMKVIKKGWLFIKTFSNKQIEDMQLSDSVIQALSDVGLMYPEIAAEIFCICENN